jgi:hypothetical protein
MNLHLAAPWRRSTVVRAGRPTAPDWVNARLDLPPAEAAPAGCGWFDSSHELQCGLMVTEHLTPERVVNEVPLGWWLDWQTSPAAFATAPGLAHHAALSLSAPLANAGG